MQYESREEYDRSYKNRDNAKINRMLTLRKVDIDDIIRMYVNAYSIRNIKILHKLSDDEMSYIFDNYITLAMDRRREENQEKLRNSNNMSKTLRLKYRVDSPSEKGTVNVEEIREKFKKAVEIVEGRGERED